MQILRSLPVQLGIAIATILIGGPFFPIWFMRGFYTFSLFFKELLGFILPFMVLFFVLAGILSFKQKAPYILSIMLGLIFCSNALVALICYGVMVLFSGVISCQTGFEMISTSNEMTPYFIFSLPISINPVHALLAAIGIGLFSVIFGFTYFEPAIITAKNGIEKVLNRFFIPLLPLYIFGFLIKIWHEGMFTCLFQQYGSAFVLIISLQMIYLIWFYLLATNFSLFNAFYAIKNALPSYITAFSTMSSAAAIPVSIQGAERNTGNAQLAHVAMPIMANVHLLGDSFVTPILAIVTMLVFQGIFPSMLQYLSFVFYFCVSMFAVSGIPGGGLLVMIPILKSQLGFTPQMISMIMTIYFLLDSFGTGANVMGDGALVIIVSKVLRRLKLY